MWFMISDDVALLLIFIPDGVGWSQCRLGGRGEIVSFFPFGGGSGVAFARFVSGSDYAGRVFQAMSASF